MAEARVKIVSLLVLIFLLGVATGGLGYHLLQRKGYFSGSPRASSHDHRSEVVSKFTRELRLNPDQSQKLDKIFEESEQKFRELNKSFRPQADAIRMESRNKIRAILSEGQKLKFEEMLQKIDEERRQREQNK